VVSRSPQHPDDIVISRPAANPAEVVAAVESARAAQREWAAQPAPVRANALSSAATAYASARDELVALGVREVGKPVTEMEGEVARGLAILRYYAQEALGPDGSTFPSPDGRSLLLARTRPRGVAGLVTPWNFPVAIPLWKAAPALAYGNGVVLKAAPQALAVATRLAEILAPCLPPGLFSVLAGDAETGRALVGVADAVSFTGSVAVGHQVVAQAAGRGTAVQAEMGGQNASIVLPDADLAAAAKTVAYAAMGYAGQKCTATSRVIVVGDVAAFTDALVAAVEALGFGDPAERPVLVGPVIEEGARRAVVDAVAAALAGGGRVVLGGEAAEGDGFYVRPALVDGLGPDAALAQEEVFGPVAVVLPAQDAAEAVAIANGVRYGLASAIFTADLDSALFLAGHLATGLVKVNSSTAGVDFYAPFGGDKESSFGPREQGRAARDFYTTSQTVTISPARSH